MQHHLPGADAPFDIVWDQSGIPHVYASTVADAYRGMGYAAGRERLWQIHMSTAFAHGEAAALLGPRFIPQDALQRAANVGGAHTGLPDSDGDWIVDAYLDGLNAVVDQLDEVPPEFEVAGAQPRRFRRADIAARYRFTSWFQHKSWAEKLLLGHLMTSHGIDYFREHVLHFSADDARALQQLDAPLAQLDPALLSLSYPDMNLDAVTTPAISGSNNWAITSARSASGKPMLATDPHQPHSIPNTFFYVHLHAGEWDAFGAAFPGVPYFMMGYTRELAWGLTTGFIDCYDTYIEQVKDHQHRTPDGWQPIQTRTEQIKVKGQPTITLDITRTEHGPLLEPLLSQLDLNTLPLTHYQTALHWSLTDIPTSAGALAQLPLARDAEEFGHLLFEDDVCPLVNNIICVDRNDGLRRFIATTQPARQGVTGSVPLPGWLPGYDFQRSSERDLTVEVNPERGFTLTANNDTMGETGPFYIHNFPTHSARADRIEALLSQTQTFSTDDFERMQLDDLDLRAASVLPDLLAAMADSEDDRVQRAVRLLTDWDCRATVDSAAACLFYSFQDRFWPRKFMRQVLTDPLLAALPAGAPGLNRFDVAHFMAADSPWRAHQSLMNQTIQETMSAVYAAVCSSLGEDPTRWRWGDLHQIQFKHALAKHERWSHMEIGPHPIGGSPTTLGMAMHMGPGAGRHASGEIPLRVYHGPAYRLIVDLADPDHARFVIAGGNGGRPDSRYGTNQFATWLKGEYLTLALRREELLVDTIWPIHP